VFADAPSKEQAAQLVGCGRTPCDDFQAGVERGGVDAAGCRPSCINNPPETCFTTGRGRCGVDFNEAQIFLGRETLAGFGGESWSGDGLDKELSDLLGGFGVDFAIDADD